MCRPKLRQRHVERLASAPVAEGQEEPAPTPSWTGASRCRRSACTTWRACCAHARGAAAFSTPTLERLQALPPFSLAPDRAIWGRDNRGVMVRVLGGPGDPATHLENRVGEPAANPYLYMASQIVSGLDGLDAQARSRPVGRHARTRPRRRRCRARWPRRWRRSATTRRCAQASATSSSITTSS